MIPNEIKKQIQKFVQDELQALKDEIEKVRKEAEMQKSTLCKEIDNLKVEIAILKEGGEI